MGIFINMRLSSSLTQEEWEPVYKTSLEMAEKMQLYYTGTETIRNNKVKCIIPVRETTRKNMFRGEEKGWFVSGGMPEFRFAETQFTPKIICSENQAESVYSDILETFIELKNGKEKPYTRIWGNKTQGEPYHMGLLAIGCMIEDALGEKAFIEGDITFGQCVNAAEIAEEVLGRKIHLPVTCSAEALFYRISKIEYIDELQKLNLFMEKYIGNKDSKLGEFIKSHFRINTISDYWKEKITIFKPGTRGFRLWMKDYFKMGFDLDDFCRLSDVNYSDTSECEKFIQIIIDSKMHIKEKDCEDVLDYTQRSDTYTIYSLMASFVFGGLANRAIDRYIPLDEIKSVLAKHCTAVKDVNAFADSYILEEENQKDSIDINSTINDRCDQLNQQYEQYNICRYDDLLCYKSGNSIEPKFEECLNENFITYISAASEEPFEELIRKSPDELFSFIAQHDKHTILTPEEWEKIYNNICEDKSSFKRYYPLTQVNSDEDTDTYLRTLVTNDDFWNYSLEHYSETN